MSTPGPRLEPKPASARLRILYLGSGGIGLPTLRWLNHDPRVELIGVITQPDKPAGRGRRLLAPPVKKVAEEIGVEIQQPDRLRAPEAVQALEALNPDLLVVFAYGQLLSQEVLDLPTIGCWNLHASLLPRHRGASPIQAAIRNGDPESGMTVMWMDRGLDTGDILCADRLTLSNDETGGSLHDKLSALAPQTLDRALTLLFAGEAPRQLQDASLATHAGKLTGTDALIDWTHSCTAIERQIRAHDPWPGSQTLVPVGNGETKVLKLFPPAVIALDPASATAPPGTIEPPNGRLRIRAADGWLQFSEVQPENSRRMNAADFLRGWRTP